jgi:hypothetical protein
LREIAGLCTRSADPLLISLCVPQQLIFTTSQFRLLSGPTVETKSVSATKLSSTTTTSTKATHYHHHHMSKLLRALRFFEEDIPVAVLKEFNPEDVNPFTTALKLCISPGTLTQTALPYLPIFPFFIQYTYIEVVNLSRPILPSSSNLILPLLKLQSTSMMPRKIFKNFTSRTSKWLDSRKLKRLVS